MDQNWAENLKVGDIVVVKSSGYDGDYTSTVSRFTKTQIILYNGDRFRKSDLYRVGDDSYTFARLVEPSETIINKIRHRQLVHNVCRWFGIRGNVEKLSIDTLKAILSYKDSI